MHHEPRVPWDPSRRAISILVAVLISYATATSIWEASRKAFWYDEVFTVVLSEKASLGEIVEALGDAVDTSGPGYYVMQRAFKPLASAPLVSHRAASIASVSLAAVALFLFARREFGPLGAAVAVFFLLVTELYHGYSVEARAYAPMVFGLSIALLAWQRASHWFWAAVLIVAIVFSIATHYFAVFALVPLAAAELTQSLRTRRIRWGVWGALAGGGLTLLSVWPLLQTLRTYYGDHYWSRPTLGKVLETYDVLCGFRFSGAGLALAISICLMALVLLSRSRGREHGPWPRPEVLVLIMGLVGVPFIVGAVTWFMQGGYTYRYSMAVLPGLVLGTACFAGVVDRRHGGWLLAMLLCGFAATELPFWASGGQVHAMGRAPQMQERRELIAKATTMGLPMMVPENLDFLPLAYYTRGQAVELVGIVERELALRHTGTDSTEMDLLALSRHLPLRLQTFQEFCRTNPEFLVLARPGGAEWWVDVLLDRGFALTATFRQTPFTLFVVKPPAGDITGDPCDLSATRSQ